MRFGKELLLLGTLCMLGKSFPECPFGFFQEDSDCVDIDECGEDPELCGRYAQCFNMMGAFYCQCLPGFAGRRGSVNFTALDEKCIDVDECGEYPELCGRYAQCTNVIGSYYCQCLPGFANIKRPDNFTALDGQCIDINECTEIVEGDLCNVTGTCANTIGSYWCSCAKGYTNYGNNRTRCSAPPASSVVTASYGSPELDCSNFKSADRLSPPLRVGLESVVSMMRNNCLTLSEGIPVEKDDGDLLLETLFTGIERVLSQGPLDHPDHVTEMLFIVEFSIGLLSPQLKQKRTRIESREADAEIAVEKGERVPTGTIRLTTEGASLDTDWTTAARTPPYPGFGLAALLSYRNLVTSFSQSFEKPIKHGEDGVNGTYQFFSRAVSFVVHDPTSRNLGLYINITFRHLEDTEESPELECMYWRMLGTRWTTNYCQRLRSNASHTVCTCNRLGTFVLCKPLYPKKPTLWLLVVAKKGLAISLLCLVVCILTFKFGRAIQGTRTTIHLHLCICLFMGGLIFLAGVSESGTAESCLFITAMLHFFILGALTWMLLEAIQLYRMVVLVFTATIRPILLYLAGYGAPLVIVIITELVRSKSAGPDQYCQLSIKFGLFWSFLTTAYIILTLNAFIFMVTAWKLAGKFASLHSDPDKELKVKCVVVTAATQACILGLIRMFWILMLQQDTVLTAYVFAILNSLQGVMLFIVHCLLSEKVIEEYACFFTWLCTPKKKQKRSYGFRGSNPSISQSQTDQHNEESQL